jgi:hypothetical protein
MSGYGDIENVVLQCIERWVAGRYTERHALVTSYDPQKYLAKVTFQPDGQESGMLPIETGHIGNGYGIAIGLTPGDGKATGDQVIVRYQESDIESGKVVQRVHSDQDTPPTAQSGEMIIYTSGKKIVISDNKGTKAVMTFDGAGNININLHTHTTVADQNVVVTSA